MSKIASALIIDDDETFVTLLSKILESAGVIVDAAKDENDFFVKLNAKNYSFCFVDLMMDNKEKGFEIITKIREGENKFIPVFILSSMIDPKFIAHAVELGVNDYITKPLDRELFLSKVSHYIGTQDALNNELSLFKIPGSGIEASVKVILKLHKIGELGMEFSSPHLVSKGLVIGVDSPTIREITGKKKQILLTVSSTWLMEDKINYGFFAEFDSYDEELIKNVRGWLQNITKQ